MMSKRMLGTEPEKQYEVWKGNHIENLRAVVKTDVDRAVN
jgi:hypothetical protein